MPNKTTPSPYVVTLETLTAGYDKLTARQRTVFWLVAGDLTSQEIAAQLGICEQTVNDHRKAITRGLGVSGKSEFRKAVRLLEKHLSPPQPPIAAPI